MNDSPRPRRPFAGVASSSAVRPESSTTARLAVPAYFGPWETREWDVLLARRPAVVIVNPANGPGTKPHVGYCEIIDRCSSVGAEVFGYLSTRWLRRSSAEIAEGVARYRDWYGVERVFFDEIPNGSRVGRIDVLSGLAAMTPTGGTVFNCGQPVPERWYRLLPNVRWGTFEGGPEQLAGSSFVGPPERQMHFVHSVTEASVAEVQTELDRRRVHYACVTDDLLPNPWDVCPRG